MNLSKNEQFFNDYLYELWEKISDYSLNIAKNANTWDNERIISTLQKIEALVQIAIRKIERRQQ